MLHSRTVIAALAVLVSSVFVLPACSTSTDDTPGCGNATKDEGEEGIDCGGTCPTLCTGTPCSTGEQCASGKCENNACAAPSDKTCGVGVAAKCNDGDKCELDKDCNSGFCDGAKCALPSADSHTDGVKNSGETGVDCGGSVKATKPCPDGQGCTDSADCVGTCTNLVCGPIGPTDGKKNGGETDIDCGGAAAPKCATGKACLTKADCVDDFCPDGTKKCTAPRYDDGVVNGDETDADCGGKTANAGFKACAETKKCLVDTDCNGACRIRTDSGPPVVTTKTCIDIPSCKNLHGGDTCGLSEIEFNAGANHESCCKSLPVAGFSDADHPGKTVYLDKYEITAGRMRAFIEAVSAQNGGVPNIKGWIAAHRPAVRWNTGWEKALPSNAGNSEESYTIADPSADPLYPSESDYDTKSITGFHFADWNVSNGPQTINVGLNQALGFAHFFPEWTSNPTNWIYPDYSATHGLNCGNTTPDGNPATAGGSAGYSTYWFDAATMKAVGGNTVVGKVFTKDQLDEKAMNCSPLAVFAAFCVWDGGQLATAEVSDAVTMNEAKLAAGMQECGPGGNTLVSRGDAGGECPGVYYYPDAGSNESYDKSFRIAPPGRVDADDVDGWKDLKGNLVEAVLAPGGGFDHRGYGIGWATLKYHKVQSTTPRFKNATTGARCMRFK